MLQHTDVLGAVKILRISWDEAHGIMERAVARGMARRKHRVPERIGIDEKSLARGHRYATIVADLDGPSGPCVLDLAEGRTKEALLRCFGPYSLRELEEIQVVAMDMSDPYIAVVRGAIGGEKIVLDRFHIMMHMNNAVDLVRRRENRALRASRRRRRLPRRFEAHVALRPRERP